MCRCFCRPKFSSCCGLDSRPATEEILLSLGESLLLTIAEGVSVFCSVTKVSASLMSVWLLESGRSNGDVPVLDIAMIKLCISAILTSMLPTTVLCIPSVLSAMGWIAFSSRAEDWLRADQLRCIIASIRPSWTRSRTCEARLS